MKHDKAACSVRAFNSVDFSQLVYIMPPEWICEGLSTQEALSQAQMDCAYMIAVSNIRLVAIAEDSTSEDPALIGALFAHTPALPEPSDCAIWEELNRSAGARLASGSRAARQAAKFEASYIKHAQSFARQMRQNLGQDNEAMLFIVAPQSRGTGAGSALLRELEKELKELECDSYWLQTDTTCSWQWYDKHGFERVAEMQAPAELCALMGDDTLTSAHPDETNREPLMLFLYKKALK